MDEENLNRNTFENSLFAILGGMCAVIVSLAVFSEPTGTQADLHRRPASVKESPTPKKTPQKKDLDPRLYFPAID